MITRLRAQNFKSWKDTGDLRLARLTGLFGTNSSGKTSLLQILPLLKQTAEFPDRNRVLYTGKDDSPVYLGTLPEIIYGHQADGALGFVITWPEKELLFDSPDRVFDELHPLKEITFRTSVVWWFGKPTVDFFRYDLGGEWIGMRRLNLPEESYELAHEGKKLESHKLTEQRHHRFLASPVKCYGFPPGAGIYFKDVLFPQALQLAFESLLGKVHYLGPIRSYPLRFYEWGGEKPLDSGWDGDQAIASILAYKTVSRVAEWLKQMDLVHSFRLQPVGDTSTIPTIYQCYVKTAPNATEVLLPDVGFGVSQILPVLANCATLPEDATLLLEQPEIHLHPFAQAALADVLIDAVKHRNIQIIVESHSEHLLRRIQRRIAEEEFAAEDAALYFCHIENGASEADELELDAYGYIKNWPKNFFGDEMEEVAKMTIAAAERRKASRQ